MMEHRREKMKWAPILGVFALLLLLANLLKSLLTKGADILGGKATVQKYFVGNLVRLIIICLLAAAFIVVLKKTWNGVRSSGEQLIYTVLTGVMIAIFMVISIMPVISISGELSNPKTVALNSYTLCTDDSGMHYVAFNDNGGVLLAIPAEKYYQLQKGNASNKSNVGQAHQLVVDGGYNDIQFYESEVSVTYYHKSIIYEKISMKQ